jgi:hypothetical protein
MTSEGTVEAPTCYLLLATYFFVLENSLFQLAQPIRLLLAFTATKFEDSYLTLGHGPKFDDSCWTAIKPTCGLAFPNLPYYIDGKFCFIINPTSHF